MTQTLWWVIRGPTTIKSLNLRSLIEPSEKWGPALQVNRLPQQVTEMNDPTTPDPTTDARIVQNEDTSILTGATMYGAPTESYI